MTSLALKVIVSSLTPLAMSRTERGISPVRTQQIVQKYQEDGVTPEMTIQRVMDDKGSDYYQGYGSDTVTAVG